MKIENKLIAALSAFLVFVISPHAFGKDYTMADFPTFPNLEAMDDPFDTKLGLSSDDRGYLSGFRKFLEIFNKSQSDFVTYCTGARTGAIFALVRGEKIVVWPERYEECKKLAKIVGGSDADFRRALDRLNTRFKSSYKQPKIDDTPAAEWSRAASSGVSFGRLCDNASRSMVLYGQPGIETSPSEVLKTMKAQCPDKWVALFTEDLEPKDPPKTEPSNEGESKSDSSLGGRGRGLAESMFEGEISNESGLDRQRAKQRLDQQIRQASAQQATSLSNAVTGGMQGKTGKDLMLERLSKPGNESSDDMTDESLEITPDLDSNRTPKSKAECDTWRKSIEQKYIPQINQIQREITGTNARQAMCKLATLNAAQTGESISFVANCDPGQTANMRSQYSQAIAYQKRTCAGPQ